jgi:hypothetical protein
MLFITKRLSRCRHVGASIICQRKHSDIVGYNREGLDAYFSLINAHSLVATDVLCIVARHSGFESVANMFDILSEHFEIPFRDGLAKFGNYCEDDVVFWVTGVRPFSGHAELF